MARRIQPTKLIHPRSGRVLADRLEVKRDIVGAGIGLMFRRHFEPGQGMWIDPCNGIHMFFMNFAIDAVFLDRKGRIRRVFPNLGRWRVVPWVWGARSVVELPEGTVGALDLQRGEELVFE